MKGNIQQLHSIKELCQLWHWFYEARVPLIVSRLEHSWCKASIDMRVCIGILVNHNNLYFIYAHLGYWPFHSGNPSVSQSFAQQRNQLSVLFRLFFELLNKKVFSVIPIHFSVWKTLNLRQVFKQKLQIYIHHLVLLSKIYFKTITFVTKCSKWLKGNFPKDCGKVFW